MSEDLNYKQEFEKQRLATNHLIDCDEHNFRLKKAIKSLIKSLPKSDLANLLIETGIAKRDYITGVVSLK